MKQLICLLSISVLLASCQMNNSKQASIFDLAAAKKIIEEKNKQFTKAHITGDTAFLNNIVTRDAKCFPPNSEVVVGRAAIAPLNVQWINYGIKEFTEETTDFFGNEDYLIDEGSYLVRYGKDNTIEKGKYINIWKKENGDWKICSNIWNTNTPEAAAK